ncbi:hypothetical protein [Roseateles cavernae]|uniref:hypothetical protein n=1 Tax=Roseateles cavernae TaxID=3153578 RepID=UPI0032E3A409
MNHLILCIALATSASARAEPASQLGAHVLSLHQRGGYQAATMGLYLRAPGGATLGLLRNSLGRSSVYAAHTWQTADRRYALTAGLVDGYAGGAVSPLLTASLRQPIASGLALRLALIPRPPGKGGSAALHLSVETDF